MRKVELLNIIAKEILQSQLRYEADKEDAYLSTIRAKEFETLQYLYDRLKNGEEVEVLLDKLKKRLPELKKMREEELLHPTFYWYDEHHHIKVLDGQCDAYRIMIRLLGQE